MFNEYVTSQFPAYHAAYGYFCEHPECLTDAEQFVMDEIKHFIHLHLPEIKRDYDEASYLNPFWKNYPPLDRGRAPKGDQYPWIEVGEQVFGNKLSRYFGSNFQVKDSGLPSGSDDRCIIASERIRQILHVTDSVWVFIDIKSAGPRDDCEHAVMSPYQISGSGKWARKEDGVTNARMVARGARRRHDFLCSMSPLYVLSDGTVAPLLTFVIKPVYGMLEKAPTCGGGQPLEKIKIASIPNGILLTQNPNLNKLHPGLFFPGKDDAKKDMRKKRARVSFDVLKQIDAWRVEQIAV